MGEWSSEVLGSLCDFCAGSAFPKSAQGLPTGDYPFIKVSDMNSGGNERCITESNNWVTESERRRIKAKLHPAGAVAFAKIGVALTFNRRRILGRPTIIDNNMMSAVPRESAVDLAFFYYLLRTVDFNTIAAGTALPYLNVSDLRQMPVQIPPLPTQRRIAHILGTLDEKIELNRRMNRTLEKMAAAIFKSWFIDFDPVHAKAEGRDPGLPAEIADLFTDRFEDSDLGPIPMGWKVGRLDGLLVLQRGFDLPVGQRKRGSVPVVMASGIGDYHSEHKVSGPGVVTGRSGKLGDVFLIPGNFWPLNTTLWVKEYRGTRPCHAYLLLKELALSSYNAGSAVPTLNRNHIHNVKVTLPPRDIVDAYEHFVMSFYRKCWANEEQNRRLGGLRDTLLPKLMSGEIEAPAVEQATGRAV